MLGLVIILAATVVWVCLMVGFFRGQFGTRRARRAARDEYDRTHNLDSQGMK